MARIHEKSGEEADMMEYYKEDGSQSLDIFNDHWDLAEHMAFFIPACARKSTTVSIGNSNSTTNIQAKKDDILLDDSLIDGLDIVFEVDNDVCYPIFSQIIAEINTY